MPRAISELNQDRVKQFIQYLEIMSQPAEVSGMTSNDLKQLFEASKPLLHSLTPLEIFTAFSCRLENGEQVSDILAYLGKIINVLHQGLEQYEWTQPAKCTFLKVMMAENDALLALLQDLKALVRPVWWQEHKNELLTVLERLLAFDCHYLKKENILFPYMEKADSRFNGLTIMWSLHDQAREQLRQLLDLVLSGSEDQTFVRQAGNLIFTMQGLVIKESLILYPAASELFTDDEFAGMLDQSFEYGFALIEPPARPVSQREAISEQPLLIESPTGRLTIDEALLIFNNLPVDITFVDEHNKVRFFNKAKDRFFPRSPAVIGRDVNRCHPAESVHVVEEIIESFRIGRQDSASFWLELKNKMVLIQYIALRTEAGVYRGVLEVSQDITGIRKLEGQRRLLQWDD